MSDMRDAYRLYIFKGESPPVMHTSNDAERLEAKGREAANSDYKVNGWELWSVGDGKILKQFTR